MSTQLGGHQENDESKGSTRKEVTVTTSGNKSFLDVGRPDDSTWALTTIEYEHHEIHSGSSFTCNYSQTVTDLNDRSIIAFKTPNTTKYLHITVAASATAVSTASIIEAPTITADEGTTLVIFNRRRVGEPTTSTVWNTSTNPDEQNSAMYFSIADMGEVTSGTVVAKIPLGASTSPVKSIGGLSRAQQEWVLKPNTLYAFEVKSLDASDNTHWIELDWYEHTDKV